MKEKPNDEIQKWFDFADEDLRSARILLHEKIYNQACFHSQQCVEKYLKGLLLLHNDHKPKLHDLKELFSKCIHSNVLELIPFRERVATLSLYYAPTRYPDAIIGSLPDRLPNNKDAEEAIEIAEDITKLVSKLVQK